MADDDLGGSLSSLLWFDWRYSACSDVVYVFVMVEVL
jgi:hypothetical protein